MAKAKEKSKYQGTKLAGDTREYREAQLKRAQKNSKEGETTNEMFAATDTAFRDFCEKANVKPTKRQASKFRNKYGAAARQANISSRKVVSQ